jgi:hypothetical protein
MPVHHLRKKRGQDPAGDHQREMKTVLDPQQRADRAPLEVDVQAVVNPPVGQQPGDGQVRRPADPSSPLELPSKAS